MRVDQSPMMRTSLPRLVVLVVVLVGSMVSQLAYAAAPNPWPFDFDAQLADDPAAIQAGLDSLGEGLPGLPNDEMTEVTLGPVNLHMYTLLADALSRAVESGPGSMPAPTRPPVLCTEHEAFVFPRIEAPSAPASCNSANAAIAAAFDGSARVCTEVEYPETYVFEHPPGEVDANVVGSFEGLIAVAGEALSHLDYPSGIVPDDFLARLRPIIAKIRYATLSEQITTRIDDYQTALQRLDSDSSCFDAAARAELEQTTAELIAELKRAQRLIDALHEDGLMRAEADRAAARADCRERDDLLHPSLTDEERILLSFYIGGIYWRARGAGLLAYPPDPGQGLLRRNLYVQYPYQLIADMTGGEGGEQMGLFLLIDENWGWDEWWDMGTTPGSADKYSDLVGMTARGKRGADSARPRLEERGYDTRHLLAGAMQMGPCYYFAWDQLRDFQLGEALQDPYMWFIEWPTSIGEFCAGAALAEGLARTMLWGRTIPPDECIMMECTGDSCDDMGSAEPDGGAPGADPQPEPDAEGSDGPARGMPTADAETVEADNGGCSAHGGTKHASPWILGVVGLLLGCCRWFARRDPPPGVEPW